MNLEKIKSKIAIEQNTVRSCVERGLITISQVQEDSYLTCGYTFGSPIYVVTSQVLISEPKLQRGVDIPDYAFDMILKQGLVLAFVSCNTIKFKRLNDKDFVTIAGSPRLPFGLDYFDPDFTYGKPILLVEGNKDLFVARQFYPYCIACETSGLSTMNKLVLSTLTNKLIVALDNDDAGIKGTNRIMFDVSFDCKFFQYPDGVKDFGDLIDFYRLDPFKYEFYRSYIQLQLQTLTGGIS